MKKLNEQEIQDKMAEMDAAWLVKGKFLHRELHFKDFVEAFSFMTAAALVAEKAGHHPNWKNTYNKVIIDLTTHDANGITTKDIDLAKAIDLLFKKYI
jgi:4a-hydroxytetrahydrobiopterin dehydratase